MIGAFFRGVAAIKKNIPACREKTARGDDSAFAGGGRIALGQPGGGMGRESASDILKAAYPKKKRNS